MNTKRENNILVSIRLMTYNQSEFIIEALESIDKQITNFIFEVVIGDDFSTDDNLERLNAFEFKNKNIRVHILKREKGNTYWVKRQELGRLFNFTDIIENCKGKYIALLDGDDYWTDPLKLQKQVDFLEANLDYSMCFHEAEIVDSNGKLTSLFNNEIKHKTYSIKDFTSKNFVATASSIFRNKIEFSKKFNNLPAGDWALHMLNAEIGKVYYIPEVMSAYRIHDGGIWSKLNHNEMILKGVEVMKKLDSFFEYKYHEEFKKGINERLLRLKKNKNKKTIKKKVIGKLKNILNKYKTD